MGLEHLDYTEMQELKYEGKTYVFNPFYLGMGMWLEKYSSGRVSPVPAPKHIQKHLNNTAFGYAELPNMADRFRSAENAEQMERLKRTSVEWLEAKTKLIRMGVSKIPDSRNPENITNFLGGMYHYHYDPKHKETLPIWDKYPLVIALDVKTNGFLGLNLHYVSGRDRTNLLLGLLNSRTYDVPNNRMKINQNYSTLVKNIQKYPNFKRCIKWYLTNHIQGQALEIKPHEWGFSIFLPLEEFIENKSKK